MYDTCLTSNFTSDSINNNNFPLFHVSPGHGCGRNGHYIQHNGVGHGPHDQKPVHHVKRPRRAGPSCGPEPSGGGDPHIQTPLSPSYCQGGPTTPPGPTTSGPTPQQPTLYHRRVLDPQGCPDIRQCLGHTPGPVHLARSVEVRPGEVCNRGR